MSNQNTTQQQTQKLGEEIEALLKIENDMRKPAGERNAAWADRMVKTLELNALLMESANKPD